PRATVRIPSQCGQCQSETLHRPLRRPVPADPSALLELESAAAGEHARRAVCTRKLLAGLLGDNVVGTVWERGRCQLERHQLVGDAGDGAVDYRSGEAGFPGPGNVATGDV